MIYIKDKESVLCKGDFRPAQLYKGKKKIAGYEIESFEGEGSVTLENCYNDRIYNAKIYGKTVWNGEPSPDNPVEVQSVGDLVHEGDYKGKYKINFIVYNDSVSHEVNVHLDEPLYKIGGYEDYIDFEKGVVVRNVKRKVFTGKEEYVLRAIGQSSVSGLYRYAATMSDMPNLYSERILVSNYFPSGTYRELDNSSTPTVGIFSTSRITFSTPIPTLSEFNSWIAEIYNTDPLCVYYPLTNSEEQFVSLPLLPQFKGTTVYEINTNISAKISGEYKKVIK